jgi:Transposase DDE domain
LAQQLLETTAVQLIIKLNRNMKQKLMPLGDRLMLRKRSIVETIIDQLKNISLIENSCYPSPVNCFVNILCGLIAYCYQPEKPGLSIEADLLPCA